MTRVRDKDEADRLVKLLTEDGPTAFCPMINGQCNVKCICIWPPYKNGPNRITYSPTESGDMYSVFGWGCYHRMFGG